jgi:hypothetical protein
MKTTGSLAILLLLLQITFPSWGKKNDTADGRRGARILIIGLNNNVSSNYYYKEQIASETGMAADSIGWHYNNIIARNIAEATAKSACKFVPGNTDPSYGGIIEKIEIKGEAESCNANLTQVTNDEMQQMLDHAQADYVLVLKQHYLKWQEQPMRTVFHMVSYTLYGKDKKEVYSGSQYFTTMNLEAPEKITQLSRKSSAKIASAIARTLDL